LEKRVSQLSVKRDQKHIAPVVKNIRTWQTISCPRVRKRFDDRELVRCERGSKGRELLEIYNRI